MDVYTIITDRILEALNRGVVPWRRPWSTSLPKNLVSGREYRGINVLLLQSTPFLSPYWVTFKQAKALGGTIKRGVHGCPVIYWKIHETQEDDGTKRRRAVLRYYTAFNLEQTEGIEAPPPIERPSFSPIMRCEEVLGTYKNGPHVEHGGSRAFYLPAHDHVQLPHRGAFDRSEDYYCTLFHEIAHSSGAAHRLNRKGVVDGARFASHAYSQEELVAEISAAFLCGHCGISPQTIDSSTSYISSWILTLMGDCRMVVDAASHAAKAVDLILGKSASQIETNEEAA